MSNTHLSYIEDFLKVRRIAVVGASRNEKEYSAQLYNRLEQLDYDVVPVNPNVESINGKRCFSSIKEIDPPPDGAILILPESEIKKSISECLDSDIKFIWLRTKVSDDTLGNEILDLLKRNEVALIRGECPFMFLPESEWFHRLHCSINKMIGVYPK